MPADPRPSYEELAALVRRQAERIAELEAEVAELRRQLGRNSRNSSKPPASDSPFDKPAPKSLRRRGGRRPGGQNGHPGSTLAQVADPDETLRHEPGGCVACGAELSGAPQVRVVRRQVFDLPPMTVRVVEHQLITRRCTCGATTCADAPDGVDAPVAYGPRAAAIMVYLYVGQFLSKRRAARALAELFGTPVSEGTVAAVTKRAADGLDTFTVRVRERIAASQVAHFDETGLRVDGKLRWVHSASTGRYSLVTVHDKRGVAAMDAAGVLPAFGGIAVHDAWAPYDSYTHATHALCNAHLLRELQAVTDTTGDGRWCWATQASDALRAMKNLVDAAHAADGTLATLDAARLAQARHLFHSAVVIGANDTKTRATKLMAKHHALARRLLDRQADYLRFTTDVRVPFDNNTAERDIRMIKLRQKVSGCLRTLTGAEQFCAIRSYLATAAKHGIHHFDALAALTDGRPWQPQTA